MYHEEATMITGVKSIRIDDSLISKSDWLLINFSLQHLPWIKYKGQEQKGNYHQFKKAPDCQTNSPCQYHKRFREESIENMDTNVKVQRVNLSKRRKSNHKISFGNNF